MCLLLCVVAVSLGVCLLSLVFDVRCVLLSVDAVCCCCSLVIVFVFCALLLVVRRWLFVVC